VDAWAQGATGIGPVTNPADIQAAIEQGIEIVPADSVCVIDARVQPGSPLPPGSDRIERGAAALI
jgi:hypothetical protein